ncbi:hypothetical protein [Larkinella punicea]|uniref:Uncharacterized protein n=1 Tax=Larkinella punicea TaxID=2315727 RepID=A0A368JS62_9BACT|nr:hypothetical protein [Larkinella punicea]RCR69443.1 hypothetical protein DUE52_11360 [Larkinella punicea]
MQKVTSAQYWKNRMAVAKKRFPDEMGQQDIIKAIVELNPTLDKLTNANRWRNAWFLHAGDPEFTELVEKIADSLETESI